MWIILEGVDGAGKSTIAEKLHILQPNASMTHLGPPKEADSALAECVDDQPFGTYRPGMKTNIISDRHHLGCPVYGPLYRPELNIDGYGDMGLGGFRYAELFLASRGATTILVTVPPETARTRLGVRGDDYIDPKDLEVLSNKYMALLPELVTFTARLHRLTGASLDAWMKRIIDMSRQREQNVSRLKEFPTYIGTIAPERLVLYDGRRSTAISFLQSTDEWKRTGFVHSVSGRKLRRLEDVLHTPEVVDLTGEDETQTLDRRDSDSETSRW